MTFAIITIDRNEQSPFFLSTPYSKGLGQGTTASETVIFTVNARDPDLNPSTVSPIKSLGKLLFILPQQIVFEI